MKFSSYGIIILVLLSIFSFLSFAAISSKSGTFDEVQHFGIGKYLLVNQKWDVMGSILHPPLGFYLTSLPLLFFDEDKDLWQYEEKHRNIAFLGAVDVVRGQGLLSAPENKHDRLLILSRLMVLLIAIVLGAYIYKFSSELYGRNAGLVSLFLYVFCPNMIGFSGISTPDMFLTAFSFISIYFLWRYFKIPDFWHALVAGVFLGCALAVKFTALLLIPFEILLYLVYLRTTRNKPGYEAILIVAVAVLILFGSYGFNITPFLQGNEYRLLEMQRGQGAFFNGQLSNHGWWYFYLAVLMLKTPIPVLLLFFTSIALFLRQRQKSLLTALMLYAPVIFLIALFSFSNFSIGIRYLLPIFPFIFVSIGILATTGNKRIIIFTSCMGIWLVVGTASICPNYLAYFNELAGGPDNGYRYLVDSNLDWGQDLKGLKKYMEQNGVKKVSLSYFGTDSPQRYGIDYDWLPSHHLFNPDPTKAFDIPPDQLIAISATNLQGVYLNPVNEFEWLRRHKPLAKIGYSIFIYDPQDIISNSQ